MFCWSRLARIPRAQLEKGITQKHNYIIVKNYKKSRFCKIHTLFISNGKVRLAFVLLVLFSDLLLFLDLLFSSVRLKLRIGVPSFESPESLFS